jgi:hypothetical protein
MTTSSMSSPTRPSTLSSELRRAPSSCTLRECHEPAGAGALKACDQPSRLTLPADTDVCVLCVAPA